jgi:hypothetical protein
MRGIGTSAGADVRVGRKTEKRALSVTEGGRRAGLAGAAKLYAEGLPGRHLPRIRRRQDCRRAGDPRIGGRKRCRPSARRSRRRERRCRGRIGRRDRAGRACRGSIGRRGCSCARCRGSIRRGGERGERRAESGGGRIGGGRGCRGSIRDAGREWRKLPATGWANCRERGRLPVGRARIGEGAGACQGGIGGEGERRQRCRGAIGEREALDPASSPSPRAQKGGGVRPGAALGGPSRSSRPRPPGATGWASCGRHEASDGDIEAERARRVPASSATLGRRDWRRQ